MEFIDKIQNILDERKITIKEMCTAIELSQQTYFNWKKGTQIPLNKAIDIIKYLGLSADEVFNILPEETKYGTGQIQFETITHWNTKEKYIRIGIDNILNSNSIDEIHENAKMIKLLIDVQ